jgi:hypothetical protein
LSKPFSRHGRTPPRPVKNSTATSTAVTCDPCAHFRPLLLFISSHKPASNLLEISVSVSRWSLRLSNLQRGIGQQLLVSRDGAPADSATISIKSLPSHSHITSGPEHCQIHEFWSQQKASETKFGLCPTCSPSKSYIPVSYLSTLGVLRN